MRSICGIVIVSVIVNCGLVYVNLVCMCALVAPLSAPPVRAPAPAEVPAVSISAPSVASEVWRLRGPHDSFGSAFPVWRHEGTVTWITAAHMVDRLPGATWELTLRDTTILGAVARICEGKNVAMITALYDGPVTLFELSPEPPRFGEALFASGYLLGHTLLVTQGYAGDLGYATASVGPGCSGGPVMRPDGSVVGVVTAVAVYELSIICYASAYEPLNE